MLWRVLVAFLFLFLVKPIHCEPIDTKVTAKSAVIEYHAFENATEDKINSKKPALQYRSIGMKVNLFKSEFKRYL